MELLKLSNLQTTIENLRLSGNQFTGNLNFSDLPTSNLVIVNSRPKIADFPFYYKIKN